ncbi:MAG: T9SS type A sorting domain-containing protein [Crocinitomicaceae bacterium]|nr:T9SS type A sorting domain-containing protein [Crocinitomicaceae bacterium]
MNKKFTISFFVVFLTLFSGFSQKNSTDFDQQKSTPVIELLAPNMASIHDEDLLRDKQGKLYRIGVALFTNISTQNAGVWTKDEQGSKTWTLTIKSSGAEALSFLFDHFVLFGKSNLKVSNQKGELVHAIVTKDDELEDLQQHLALCFGDELTLTLTEPKGTQASEIHLDRVIYNYRSTGNPAATKINESDPCEINVNCSPVGDNWQDEKRGVARIYVVEPAGAGWCSGSLINNTAQDCKPYMLTALHCGVNSTTANFNVWKFYFKYEVTGCTNPTSAGTLASNVITGSVKKADANDNGGDSGSDFLLVQMGTTANETVTINKLKTTGFNAYWNGWDANNTATTGGVGIHHPAGDIKKISTFNGTTASSTYGGQVSGTHWRLTWSSNSNGHGVTEGGSSGSPIFNNSNGRIIGTLTGGSSYCNALTSPDLYGKMSYHWTSNGTQSIYQLKPFLDPTNSGLMVLNGAVNPCSPAGIEENEVSKFSYVSIFPNPFTAEFTVDLTSLEVEDVLVSIYDFSGKLIETINSKTGQKINVNLMNYAEGVYQVKLATKGAQITKLVVKK